MIDIDIDFVSMTDIFDCNILTESKLDAVTVERDSSTKVLVESEKASQLLTIDHNAGNEG